MSRGEVIDNSPAAPIEAMIQEHHEVGDALAKLRKLTNGFQPPAQACNTYHACRFAGTGGGSSPATSELATRLAS